MNIIIWKITHFQLKPLIQFRSAQFADLLQNSKGNQLANDCWRGKSRNL